MPLYISDFEMKILILFALKTLGGALSPERLCDLLSGIDINYIDIKSAFAELVEQGSVLFRENDGETIALISKESVHALEALKHKVPIVVREKVAIAATAEIMSIRHNLAVSSDIIENEQSDDYTVKLFLKDDDRVLFELSLFAPTKMQAEILSKNFSKKALLTYKKLISTLTEQGEETEKKDYEG